jgi:hypothetical protein
MRSSLRRSSPRRRLSTSSPAEDSAPLAPAEDSAPRSAACATTAARAEVPLTMAVLPVSASARGELSRARQLPRTHVTVNRQLTIVTLRAFAYWHEGITLHKLMYRVIPSLHKKAAPSPQPPSSSRRPGQARVIPRQVRTIPGQAGATRRASRRHPPSKPAPSRHSSGISGSRATSSAVPTPAR